MAPVGSCNTVRPSLTAFGRAFARNPCDPLQRANPDADKDPTEISNGKPLLAAHDNCTASLSLQLMLPNVAKEMPSQDAPAPISDTNSDYIRLHVTPFNPDLVKVILGSSILPKARNISYHALETFPENSYGFVELPKEDAEKLKTKLNGAVLKGVKIRIQPARPATLPEPLGEAAMGGDKSSKRKESRDSGDKTKEKSRKRERDQDEIPGVVLEEGRKVKRGWTSTDEPSRDKDKKSKKDKKDKKDRKERKQTKSKYTEHEECLVKTILPANMSTSATADDAATPEKKKKKKKHGSTREVVVHEFEKTTKFPTFLKSTVTSGPAPASLEYVEGKGWVNDEGNVVEPVKSKPQTSYKIKAEKKSKSKREETRVEKEESDSDAHDSADDSEGDSSAPASGAEVGEEQQDSKPSTKPQSLLVPPKSSTLPISPGSAKSLTIKIPPATPEKVHPLEALYKKPQQADGEVAQDASQGFSFFGNAGGDDVSEEDSSAPSNSQQVPMTPFTREDIELRGLRSAAPTPDTAHPSRKFKPWAHEDEDIEEEEAEDDEDGDESSQMDGVSGSSGQAPGTGPGESTSDFQKWFWENRGDLNRSWKKRRKMASKEKRYRENKARLARAI